MAPCRMTQRAPGLLVCAKMSHTMLVLLLELMRGRHGGSRVAVGPCGSSVIKAKASSRVQREVLDDAARARIESDAC